MSHRSEYGNGVHDGMLIAATLVLEDENVLGGLVNDHFALAIRRNIVRLGMDSESEWATNWTLHPGFFVRESLDESGLTLVKAAELMGLHRSQLSRIIHRKNLYSAQTAIKLATVLGGTSAYWWQLCTIYQLDLLLGRKDMLDG